MKLKRACISCKYYRPRTVHEPKVCLFTEEYEVVHACSEYKRQPWAWIRNLNWRATA